MGFWDKIDEDKMKDARSTQGGVYFTPGRYPVVQVLRCKMIKTQERHDAFIAECRILVADDTYTKKEGEEAPLQAGDEPALYVDMDGKYPDLSLGNVMDFMRAGLASLAEQHGQEHPPVEQIEVGKDEANSVTGAENLLAGVLLSVTAFNKPTREGRNFTRIKWAVPADVAALAEEHGAAA